MHLGYSDNDENFHRGSLTRDCSECKCTHRQGSNTKHICSFQPRTYQILKIFTYFPLFLRQKIRGRSNVSGRSSVCPSVNTYFARRNFAVLSADLNETWHKYSPCEAMGIAKTFQGQRSNIRSNAVMAEACILTVCGIDACLF